MYAAAKIFGVIVLAGMAGAYFQLGLYLTSHGTPFPIMYGLGPWMAWLSAPIAIVAVLWNDVDK